MLNRCLKWMVDKTHGHHIPSLGRYTLSRCFRVLYWEWWEAAELPEPEAVCELAAPIPIYKGHIYVSKKHHNLLLPTVQYLDTRCIWKSRVSRIGNYLDFALWGYNQKKNATMCPYSTPHANSNIVKQMGIRKDKHTNRTGDMIQRYCFTSP